VGALDSVVNPKSFVSIVLDIMKFTRLSLAKRIILVAIAIVFFLAALIRRDGGRTSPLPNQFDSISFQPIRETREVS
jgi:ABC-type Co2+ transport system permease subunit